MAIKLGTTTASLYLGSTPVAAYLGAEQVYSAATVPGAPEITLAEAGVAATDIRFTPPDDGGSAITGYKFYFEGVEKTPSSGPTDSAEPGELIALFSESFLGQAAEVSAVNAIGEGPKSDPVTVAAF
jgi:hypothetical protein